MKKIELIPMGPPIRDLNFSNIARIANKSQDHYQFVIGDGILNLGSPNESGEYKVSDLAKLLEARRSEAKVDVAIGVIDSPLYWELFSSLDKGNNNIVISIDDIHETLERTKKSYAAYVLVEIAAQLLTIEYRRLTGKSLEPEECGEPWHKETKSCLFDYSDYRPHSGKKLIDPHLCDSCRALLSGANLRQTVTTSCLSIVRVAVRTSFLTLLKDSASNPVVQILFSGWMVTVLSQVFSTIGLATWQVILIIIDISTAILFIQYLRNKYAKK
jgi:hypothetical protein